METIVKSAKSEVIISCERPTVIIGEKINPTGRDKLSAELANSCFDIVCHDAKTQVALGAGILDINVGVSGLDEVALLPKAVEAVSNVVDVPLCFDSNNPKALRAALEMYDGRAIINSVTGEKRSLAETLPLAKEFNCPIIALTIGDKGIAKDVETHIEIAYQIVEQADSLGIPRSDIIIDCLAMAVGADGDACNKVLTVIRRIHSELGLNQTLGASNVSFGMPARNLVNNAFISLAIDAGVSCPIANAEELNAAILATDLVLGKDHYAQRYSKFLKANKQYL